MPCSVGGLRKGQWRSGNDRGPDNGIIVYIYNYREVLNTQERINILIKTVQEVLLVSTGIPTAAGRI